MTDSDFPCLNEEYGLECEYPFCNCESEYYDDKLQELPEIFERGEMEWPTEYEGEWLEDEED